MPDAFCETKNSIAPRNIYEARHTVDSSDKQRTGDLSRIVRRFNVLLQQQQQQRGVSVTASKIVSFPRDD